MSPKDTFDFIVGACGLVLGSLAIPLTGLTIWLDRQPTTGGLGWAWAFYRCVTVIFGIAIMIAGVIYGASIVLAHL